MELEAGSRMPTISFGGLGNGIDFGQVVDQLAKVQRIPIEQLQEKKTALQTKLTDYGTVGTSLLKLQSAADALRLQSSFDRTVAAVSNEDILGVTAASTATPGTYQVRITQLATAHQITHKAVKAVASPTVDIVGGAGATFSFQVGTSAVQTVTLGDSATLEDLRTAINDLGAGVNASIVNTGTSAAPAYRLLLTSTSTGVAGPITVTADSTNLDFLNGSGTGGHDTLQVAQDAVVVLGDPSQAPLTLQRSSNTIADAIPGVTLNLKKATAVGESALVTVSLDTDAAKTNIKNLVTAFNDIVKFVNERNTYDAESKKGGAFFADGAARTAVTNLRNALSNDVSGLVGYGSVGAIGFKTERDGTIAIDEAKLDAALSTNYNGVKALFVNGTSIAGVAQRVTQAVDALDDVEKGTITARKNSLTDQIERMDTDIQRKQDALSAYEARLRTQFASLDRLLREMQSQGDFLRSRVSSAK